MLFEKRTERVPITPCPKRQKYFIVTGLIGASMVDNAAEIAECFSLRFEYRPYSAVDRQTAEVDRPGHSNVFKVTHQRFCKQTGIGRVNRRIAWIGACHGAQQKTDVSDGPRHRAFDTEAQKRQ